MSHKLSVKEKVGYALGDTASNLYFQMFINFLLFFYTDVFGIPAAVAGTLFMVSRFWDAVNDPMMGVIADRTNTKWGKFRPYLLWIMLPMAVVGVFMFTTPNLSIHGKIVYAYVTYIMMMMAYTAINIPYSALMGVLSPDSMQRTSASTYRFVLAFVGAFIVQGATLMLVNNTGAVDTGYQLNGTVLTLSEVDTRTAKIIVRASDGTTAAENEFLVNINREGEIPPAVIMATDSLKLEEGFGSTSLALSDIFADDDSDKLTYSLDARSNDVMDAVLDGDRVTLTEKGAGMADILLTASDDTYGETNFTLHVAVNAQGNRAPAVAAPLADITGDKSDKTARISLAGLFSDEDGDALSYKVRSSNTVAISADVKGEMLTVRYREAGLSVLDITAVDGRGGMAQSSVNVMVGTPGNDAPVVFKAPANVTLNQGFGRHVIDLKSCFKDLEGDDIVLSVKKVDVAKGFQFTLVVFGLLGSLLFFITFKSTRERVQPPKDQQSSLKNDFRDLLRNRPWMVLLVMGIFTLGYVIIRMGAIMYYFKYYVGNEMLASLFMVLGTVAVIAGVACTEFLSKRMGKKKLYLWVMGLTTLFTALFYHVPKENITLVFTVHIIISFVMAPQAPLLWAMYADTADYSEWRNKRRATGLIFSAATFAQKFGMALGGGLAGWLLSMFHFQPNVEQTAEALTGIRLMMSYIPAAGTLIAVLAALFYELDEKTMKTIEKELAERKA